MRCKQIKVGHLACAAAMGLIAVAPGAQAQSDMSTTTTSTTVTTSQPTLVTGTVLRYYVDRSGYVTAMDVQTAEGVQFVRFSPGMGTRLYNTYPVGGTASVYVTGSPTSRWDVVSVGATAPAPGGMMMPYTVTDAELLDAEPYIMAGAKMVTVSGRLRNLIVNDRGEIVGLVLGGGGGGKNRGMMETAAMTGDGTMMTSSSTASGDTMTTTTTTTTTNMAGASSMMGMEPRGILVRVPREFRHIAPGYAGTERVTPLFKGAVVEVTGYPEAPRYGVLDIYNQRIAANALVVNGRAVGALGIPMMSPKATRALFGGVDLGGTGRTSEEMRAAGMGYTVYGTSTSMGGDPAMTTDAAGTTSTGTGTDGTTMR